MLESVIAPVEEAARTIMRFHGELGRDQSRLLGYVMALGYDEGVVVTNDYYKMRSGGVSKNSFLLVRPISVRDLIHPEDREAVPDFTDQPPHLILVRVLEPAPTPLSQEVARTYFEMHKSHMPELDVFTKSELQWGAIRIAVLGTFYDDSTNSSLEFGGDMETFLSPHMYTVHVPTPQMLERLVNAFVADEQRTEIGTVRMTESRLSKDLWPVPVYVSPRDFIGARTALFGKTRMGKSNTVKIIARIILDSGADVGQVIFDLNGEYAYWNPQDNTSLYDQYPDRCVRYSLRPKLREGVKVLKGDFFQDLSLGHSIIKALHGQRETTPPDYLKAFLEWEFLAEEELEELEKKDRGAATRYRRNVSIYQCILHEAGFDHADSVVVDINMNKTVRERLAGELRGIAVEDSDGKLRIPARLELGDASVVFQKAWAAFVQGDDAFETESGRDYFDETAKSLLAILTKKKASGANVSGFSKLVPYRTYHSRYAGQLLKEILEHVDNARTVILDLSNAPGELVRFFGDLVCRSVFAHQMDKFTSDALGDHFVQFYFEEAHNLFPRADTDLSTIYNRLAKEGAKLSIGIVYSTQSIESLSPDLLKNTENFFIAHLNDDREVKALTRFHEFRDVGQDVQRTKSRGYVRMITQSHRFALPVQIGKFGPRE